jgi:hypothetical protein
LSVAEGIARSIGGKFIDYYHLPRRISRGED